MRIYTKTGDDGTTGLIGGSRTEKTSLRIRAIGDVDELNAALGLVTATDELREIQSRLFDLGATLATPTGARFNGNAALELEASIDRQTADLPALRNFILPGGSSAAAYLHLARTICRRAERSVLELDQESPVPSEAKVFLNRLSDWLFTAARTANATRHVSDVEWRPQK